MSEFAYPIETKVSAMKWNSLISTQNLKLAWRRINTGRNIQYKRFFREAFLVYESAVDENIKELHKSLEARAWTPQHAVRLYLPKPSGLQRPLSLLEIEDQILLQAISNKFADKLRTKRNRVELNSVFSNKLTVPRNSIFFTENWTRTYPAFQEKCTEAFNLGYKWSAHFDLAAYYDTISHELLLSIASVNPKEPETGNTIKNWLRVWSADNSIQMTGHGIPQGPIASDFLAESFFLPIDLQLQKEPIIYLRYVDDIRLFGQSESEVREAAILLEQECRHRGLIPQSSKFAISELKSAKEAMGSLPSIPPTAGGGAPVHRLTPPKAIALLNSTIKGRPQRIVDKSRFRYLMYRAPSDTQFLDTVLRLLPRHPEHIDSFVAYFEHFGTRPRIARAALDYLETNVPYSYVRGELWHLVARLGSTTELNRGLPIARIDARKRSCCVALSWGVMHFLMRCEKEGVSKIGKRLAVEAPISKSLLAPIFDDHEFAPTGQAVELLRGQLMEQLAGARELQRRRVTLNGLGLRQRDLPDSCKRSLLALGVARRLHRLPNRDWIAKCLLKIYGCNGMEIWRLLLAAEYEHALQILTEAKSRIQIDKSGWLNQQDSFNDAVTRRFFDFLRTKGLPGYSMTVQLNGNLIDYGGLIAITTPFNAAYPAVASALRNLHSRRNRLPGSHPYDKRGGARNVYLDSSEQATLISDTRNALDAISNIVDQNK